MTVLAKSGLFLALCVAALYAGAAPNLREWRFDVTADGIPVGTHRYIIEDDGARRRVQSDMHLRLRLLVVDAYQYDHHATEIWQNDCLSSFETRTEERGSSTAVTGHRDSARFEIDGAAGKAYLPECVMTFAYWNPHVLDQSHLVNAQTGAWTPVTHEKVGREEITVRGQPRMADHYRLRTEKSQIELWYSTDGSDWLAMRTRTNSGHVLAYRLR